MNNKFKLNNGIKIQHFSENTERPKLWQCYANPCPQQILKAIMRLSQLRTFIGHPSPTSTPTYDAANLCSPRALTAIIKLCHGGP